MDYSFDEIKEIKTKHFNKGCKVGIIVGVIIGAITVIIGMILSNLIV